MAQKEDEQVMQIFGTLPRRPQSALLDQQFPMLRFNSGRQSDFDYNDRNSKDPDYIATEQFVTMFRNDPSLHQDVLNYVGTRTFSERIVMSSSDLMPSRRIQLVILTYFWMLGCGLGTTFGAIAGVTMTDMNFTQRLRILNLVELSFSWLFVWEIGVCLLLLHFVFINCILLIGPLFRSIFEMQQVRTKKH